MKESPLTRAAAACALFLALATGHMAQAKPANPFAAYEVVYRLPSGENILVSRMGMIEEVAWPYFLDWQTGRYGYLTAAEQDREVAFLNETGRKDLTVEVIPDSGHGYLRMQEQAIMKPIAPMVISRAYFAAI